MEGRAASPIGSNVGWPDLDGGRVLVLDQRGMVAGILQGAAPDGRLLARPAFVAEVDGGGVLAIEADGSALRFRGGAAEAWVEPWLPAPLTSASGDVRVATRTVLEFDLAPLRRNAPLLWVQRGDGEPTPVGLAARASQPFLGPLENAGWSIVADGGAFVYAAALRPELHRYDSKGELEWVSRWAPSDRVEAPTLRSVDGQVSPAFEVLQYAVANGPDGLVYVLAASTPDTRQPDLLLAFDETGELIRSGRVEPNHAVFVSRSGHVYTLSPHEVVARTGAPDRVAFEPFELPALGSDATLSLERHRGKVVVVNFWASWCGPCRREMPQLDDLARAYEGQDVVVLGLNEDVDADRARAFLDEIGGVVYANARGGGRLRDRYRYRGLPYTVILDRELREVSRVYGFGTSIAPIRDAVEEALRPDEAG